MVSDSDEPGMPPDDTVERHRNPESRNFAVVFAIYAALMLFFHPACVRGAFGLRHMPSPYLKVYCVAMIVLVLRGLISSHAILFWLGVVAALMFVTAFILPTLS